MEIYFEFLVCVLATMAVAVVVMLAIGFINIIYQSIKND
jgi:hypothetical protein